MADLSLTVGGDLLVGPTGDLALVDGPERGLQRVLRRLITVASTYLYHRDYGAGLPARVGDLGLIEGITAVIRAQIFLEDAVRAEPAPTVAVSPILNGVFVAITYTDAATGLAQTLSFEVT